jgi:cytochrome b6-f complex iron-sulfur subunit
MSSSDRPSPTLDPWPLPLAKQGAEVPRERLPRRRFLRSVALSSLGLGVTAMLGSLVDYLWPRNVKGFGGPVPVGNVRELAKLRPGAPLHLLDGQLWLVNLRDWTPAQLDEQRGEGLLALWHRCPHLGCTVPWRPELELRDRRGWFRCPCHGSTYDEAGVRIEGPATRSMDTIQLTVDDAGNVVAHTNQITPGSLDNAARALPFGNQRASRAGAPPAV